VYSFGYNRNGCLGIESMENENTPQKIEFENNEKIIKIFTGCCCYGAFFYSSFNYFFFYIFFNFNNFFYFLFFFFFAPISF
jgi:hypothetical protein